ncbi:MAG TPA: MarR family transcriptional regulator [Solirubrobacterales bacterium]|nr:MarR family transcriptional regulator [Solirubrobacterales bacterium]
MATRSKHRELTEQELDAWRGLLGAHSSLIATLDAELEREHGMPLTTYEVLLQLANAPDCSLRMGELADRLYLSRSGLTRLIDRLVKAGLVERTTCESDRRGSFARLTDEGRRNFEAARPTHLHGVRAHFLSRLDGEDLDRLAEIWAKLAERPAQSG